MAEVFGILWGSPSEICDILCGMFPNILRFHFVSLHHLKLDYLFLEP